jgi:hypothetical protein
MLAGESNYINTGTKFPPTLFQLIDIVRTSIPELPAAFRKNQKEGVRSGELGGHLKWPKKYLIHCNSLNTFVSLSNPSSCVVFRCLCVCFCLFVDADGINPFTKQCSENVHTRTHTHTIPAIACVCSEQSSGSANRRLLSGFLVIRP